MKLPNLPLLEVVFELRWHVIRTDKQTPFGYDPVFHLFADDFAERMEADGFNEHEHGFTAGPSVIHQITNRFRKSGSPFPLVQIGPGIAACNVSTDYEWEDFKVLLVRTVSNVLATYPSTSLWALTPCQLELRYVDIFNESLLEHRSLEQFLRDNTNIDYRGFAYLESDAFKKQSNGSIVIRRELSDESIGYFEFAAGDGSASNTKGIILTSKVVKANNFPDPKQDEHLRFVETWAEAAHSITSSFFRALVSNDLMKVFQQK